MAYRLIRAPQVIVYEGNPYRPASAGHYGWGEPFVYSGTIAIEAADTRVRVVSGTPLYSNASYTLFDNPTLQLWQWIEGSAGSTPSVQSVVWLGETGWNAGGKTHRHMKGSGDFTFKLSDAVGAIAGLARAESAYGFSAIEHGWYLHGGTLEIIESGAVVFTLGSAPPGIFSNLMLGVRRRGMQVSYTLEGGEVFTSQAPSTGPVAGMGIPYTVNDYVDQAALTDYVSLTMNTAAQMRLSASNAMELSMAVEAVMPMQVSAPTILDMRVQPALQLLAEDGGLLQVKAAAFMRLSAEPALSVAGLSLYGRAFMGLTMETVGQAFEFKPVAQAAMTLLGDGVAVLNARAELSPWMRLSGHDTRNSPQLSPISLKESSYLETPAQLQVTSSLGLGSFAALEAASPLNSSDSLGAGTFGSLEMREVLPSTDGLAISSLAELASDLHFAGVDGVGLGSFAALEDAAPLSTRDDLSITSFAQIDSEFRLERLERVALHLSAQLETLTYLLAPDGLTFADFAEITSSAPLQNNEGLSVGFSAQLESGSLLAALSGLSVGDFAELRLQIDLNTLDGLRVADAATLHAVLELVSLETLIIHAGQSAEQQEATQYAINLVTGAVSTYQGAHFAGYTHAAQTFFGWRADGLYQLGTPHSEDISARVDLGSHDFGSAQLKHVLTAWLGLRTDADQVRLILASDDGTTRTYVVRGVDTVHRALLSKGAVGRFWNVAVELDGARHAVLDGIDLDVAASQRRRR